jgi:hypothetical protein
MRTARIYTAEELQLICNPALTAVEIGEILKVHPQTVHRERKKLKIQTTVGAKLGRPNIKAQKQVSRTCIGKDCNNEFRAGPSSKKKYCSHSCQQKTVNVAKKGVGTRKARNPQIKEYKKYSRTVHALSQKVYEQNMNIINPNNYPRTLCGIDGGWQLDHIKPIKECFQQGLSPTEAASLTNLRMLPWHTNLMRQFKE